jgi:single-stranded-DNA-specific exonuclease
MALGIECLLTDDASTAAAMAAELDRLNRDRKEIEADMQSRALDIIRALHLEACELPLGLCLFDPQWHQGVIGILAARIKEGFQRPVIACARADNGELKGSARSVPGLHIRDVLAAVAAAHPGLIRRFGGHAMAAGLTLDEANFPAFSRAFTAEVARWLTAADLNDKVYTDGELRDGEFSLETARLLRDAGPWGQGFPAPVFDGRFEVLEQRVVGGRHLKLRLKPHGGLQPVDAIAFNTPLLSACSEPLRLAYRLEVNEFRGVESPQLIVEYLEGH